jgi:hypothetical protein
MTTVTRARPGAQAHRRLATLAATAFLGTVAWLVLTPAQAAAAVGVSVQISQPGVYGRIDIGRFPQPQVVVAQPVLVRPVRHPVQPVYMWVPPGHRNNWHKHCGRYNACGVPVYFVQDRWYDNNVKKARGHRAHKAHKAQPAYAGQGRQNGQGHQDQRGGRRD